MSASPPEPVDVGLPALARLAAARSRAAARLGASGGPDRDAWLLLEQRWRDLRRRLATLHAGDAEIGSGLREVASALADDLTAAFDRFRPRQ